VGVGADVGVCVGAAVGDGEGAPDGADDGPGVYSPRAIRISVSRVVSKAGAGFVML
jgi:hypothetical protein